MNTTVRKNFIVIVFGTMIVLVPLALVIVALAPAQTGVTEANFGRIEDGMTIREVERIFGREPERDELFHVEMHGPDAMEGMGRRAFWTSDNGDEVAIVFFNDQVCRKGFLRSPNRRSSFVEYLRQWVGL
jgi:hypothetical protein